MIKSTIAAVAATPFLFAGAAFAGPYVNLEATGSYPDGTYTSMPPSIFEKMYNHVLTDKGLYLFDMDWAKVKR